MSRGRGRFVVLEGPDGVGKTTQGERLAAHLNAQLTREPGGTPLGERIRNLVLDPALGPVSPHAEALLMAAARAQHTAEVIEPALREGRHVVCDRYLYSSVAYQGYGRALDPEEIRRLSLWATGALQPDLVVLLDGPRRGPTGGDRLEAEGEDFHRRVVEGYRLQAAADPQRWAVVDASGGIEDTAARILEVVRSRLAFP